MFLLVPSFFHVTIAEEARTAVFEEYIRFVCLLRFAHIGCLFFGLVFYLSIQQLVLSV